MLPVAIGVALLLLLSSASLQTVALQSHGLAAAAARARRAEDDLASAAHDLVGELNLAHRCLLGRPSAAWRAADPICPAPVALTGPRRLETPAVDYVLLEWSPAGSGTAAELLLERPAASAEPARRAAFAVRLAGTGSDRQAVAVRPLGLRGVME